MDLHIPDGIFSMSDLEKANTQLSADAVRARYVAALVEGRIEVVETPHSAENPFVYRKSENKK